MVRALARGSRAREVRTWCNDIGPPRSDSRTLAIARRLLKSLTIKQGIKYDSPESTREISAFIQFHNLKVDEILDPVTSFSRLTFFWFSSSA